MTTSSETITWIRVCDLSQIIPDTGVGALVNDLQIALFRLLPDDGLYAIGAHDPFSGANVLARGIVGDKGGIPVVASPIYKQVFNLTNGQCLDDDSVSVPSYPVRLVDGSVEVGIVAK